MIKSISYSPMVVKLSAVLMRSGFILMLLTFSQSACSQKSIEQNHIKTSSVKIAGDSQRKFSSKKQLRSSVNQPAAQKKIDGISDSTNNQIRNLGNGFKDHGAAVPYATSRGTVPVIDKDGHHLILTWLYDQRGTYSLLLIDADSRESKQFSLPFSGDSYTSLLSSRNQYYTHFDGHFIEFDPDERKFTFTGKTSRGTAMSMAEDDNGTIWAALMPNCNLISYNPDTQDLTDYGSLYAEKARQLPRSIAADNSGWIYVTAGPPGKEKVVTFNPKSRETTTLSKEPRKLSLFRAQNGKVFSRTKNNIEMEFYDGKKKDANTQAQKQKSYITGNQALFNRLFSDGLHITDYVSAVTPGFLKTRDVTVDYPESGKKWNIKFDYQTEGADLMGIATSPNGLIVGGSNFPRFFFRYEPETGKWSRRGAYGQSNTLATQGDRVFIGTYNEGALLEWNPNTKWIPTNRKKKGTNPQYLAKAYPYISRPNDLLAYPDGRTVIMAGRPSYGRSSGGLLFWDSKANKADVLKQIDGLANQSTNSLVALSGGKILGGTTIKPGDSGGKRLAKEAELYIMDLKSRKVEWEKAVIPGVVTFEDLCVASNGLVMGVAGSQQFFVFDPKKRKIIRRVNLKKAFGSKIPYTQGQRSFVKSPEGDIYLLLQNGILKVDPQGYDLTLLARTPEKITGGGAYLHGRIYYTGGGRSRIQSYTLSGKN